MVKIHGWGIAIWFWLLIGSLLIFAPIWLLTFGVNLLATSYPSLLSIVSIISILILPIGIILSIIIVQWAVVRVCGSCRR